MAITLHPFAFEKEGKFSTPCVDALISVYGANTLLAHTPRSLKEQNALDALRAAVAQMETEDMCTPTRANDESPPELKEAKRVTCIGGVSYADCCKKSYVAVQPSKFEERFVPEHTLNDWVTVTPKTWRWNELLTLRPHKKVLENLANENEVTFNSTMLQRTATIKGLMDKEAVTVRSPNSVADLGRASGFVLYTNEGYLDGKCNATTIEKALVFGSERLAQMAINRYGWTDGVIVEVEVSLKRVLGTAPDGQLNEALSALQKERLKEALEHMEIDALRERLAQLEGSVEPQNAPSKRKM